MKRMDGCQSRTNTDYLHPMGKTTAGRVSGAVREEEKKQEQAVGQMD